MKAKNNKKRIPHFISFEGGEGAGKTTLIEQIEQFFLKEGFTVVKTREPGGTPFGDKIRSLLLSHNSSIKIDAKAELLLFLSSRAQHIEEVIKPAIQAGKVVLCDRFNDSTIAYQGFARGQGIAWVRSLCEMVCEAVRPEITLYLDVDPKIGLSRTKKTSKENAIEGELDRIETEALEFHQKVRNGFLAIAKEEPNRFYSIDASQSQRNVKEMALKIISNCFGLKYV